MASYSHQHLHQPRADALQLEDATRLLVPRDEPNIETTNFVFVNAVVYFFVALIALTFLLRIYNMGSNHLRHLFASGPGRDRQTIFTTNKSSWWPWVKRFIIYAPTFDKRHNRELQIGSVVSFGTLPSRFHSFILFAYVSTNIAYCLVLNWTDPKLKILAELRGRSGVLGALNLIPTILFAFRNNPLIPILKVSYDTFNLLHRWTARIVILEIVVHTAAWIAAKVDEKGWKSVAAGMVSSAFLGWGTVGTVAMILILLQSWNMVRHAFYETFISVHRLLAIAALIGTHIHVEKGALPQTSYMKVIWFLFAAEYFLRSGRLLWHNVRRHKRTKITVEGMPSEACRITVDTVSSWKYPPGSHVHLWLPLVGYSNIFSTHPFSVAWAENHVVSHYNEKLPITERDLDNPDKSTTTISLVTRARTGLTRSLYNKAMSSPQRIFTTYGAVEGPYGGHESLDSYGTVLLFAGGIGITHQIPFIKHLVQGCEDGTVATRKIVLVWSVPNTEALEWVRPWMDEILKMKGRRDVLKIMLFVTKPKSQQEVISGTGTVQMFPGRCSPSTVIDKEIHDRIGAMCVTVCGPGSFADSVREAARKRTQYCQLDMIEEAFTY